MSFAARKIPFYSDSFLYVRPFSYPVYSAALVRDSILFDTPLDTGSEEEELQAERLRIKHMAEHILVGWEGFRHRGEMFLYSPENAVFLLSQCPEIYARVVSASSSIENSIVALINSIRVGLETNLKWKPIDLEAARRYEKRYKRPAPVLRDQKRQNAVVRFYVEHFLRLSMTRGTDFGGPTRISETSISEYSSQLGYNKPDDALFFRLLITECDSVYLQHVRDTQPGKNKS